MSELTDSNDHLKRLFAEVEIGLGIFDWRNGEAMEVNPALRALAGRLAWESASLFDWLEWLGVPDKQQTSLLWRATTGDVQQWQCGTEVGEGIAVFEVSLHWMGGRDENLVWLSVRPGNPAQQSIEQALAFARDEALKASQLKSEFLATVSHEIRTPMNAVIGMTELLLNTPLSREQREYGESIRDSSNALLTLLNDMLDFSKIEAGKMTLEEIDFSLPGLVEGVSDLFASRVRLKKLDLMAWVTQDAPTAVHGDPTRLRQVLVNLTGNAVKFTETGAINLWVDLHEDTTGKWLRFNVQDSGIGLNEAARKRLFEPFTQADGSTTRRYGGTGLGLAISRRLVEMMGGRIGVESEEGKGSIFRFIIPLIQATHPENIEQPPSQELQNWRILVADPIEAQGRAICETLSTWGAVCGLATNFKDVLEIVLSTREDEPLQVVIISKAIGRGDFYRLCRELQQYPALKTCKFLLLTAADEPGLWEEALNHGFSAYLVKPIKRLMLLDTLQSVVTGQPLHMRITQPPTSIKEVERTAKKKGLVLLVEDNLANLRLGRLQLERLGYQVETVRDGLEAVQTVQTRRKDFCMVLMDCQMPGMDGLEATRQIRKLEQDGTHLPVVAMTANAMQGDRDECIAAGMDDYISKPVTLTILSQVVDTWAGQNTQEEKVEVQMEELPPAVEQTALENIRALQVVGEPDFLTEMIDIYLMDAPVLMDRVQRSLREGDVQGARKAVHSLKGISGNLGARRFSDLCERMQLQADAENLGEMQTLEPKLEREFERVCAALEKERMES